MKTEREMFEAWAADQDLDITIVDFSSCVKLVDHNGKSRMFRYEEFDTDIAWKSWLASAQREGYKLVPIETLEESLDWASVAKWDSPNNARDEEINKHEEIIRALIGQVNEQQK